MPTSPPRPPLTSILWRYMSLEQYLHLLISKGVFLSFPGKLNDPFEGSLPTRTIIRLRSLEAARCIERSTKRGHVVSCWHEMEHESDAMWRLYAGRGCGIAIKTDFGSLLESLVGQVEPYHTYTAGRVRYVDYDTEDIPVLHGMSLFYKRLSFAHEHEVRVVCFENESETKAGVVYRVEIQKLIHEIVVSPLAETWLFDLAKNATMLLHEPLAGKVRDSGIAKRTTLEEVLHVRE